MHAGQSFDAVGTIADRQGFYGGKSVKATLRTDEAGSHTVVWWAGGLAPQNGDRVRVLGKVVVFNGDLQVRADQTFGAWKQPPRDKLARLVGFYRDCVEADAAASLQFQPGGTDHVQIIDGPSPFQGRVTLPDGPNAKAWCEQRTGAIGETLIVGWPLIVGHAGRGGSGAAPLLVTEVSLRADGGVWRCERLGGYVEFNGYALERLGYSRDEREGLAKAVDGDPGVANASDAASRAQMILQVLTDGGVDGLSDLDPGGLCELRPTGQGVWNAGVVMATFGRADFVRKLAEDLDELINRPALMRRGPAAVLLRHAAAPDIPLPSPHPTLVPSSIEQDRAVHAAMTREFTVVTGPPGTGKSQVLVNVVAAAVERGETVLLASKNNKAVDVVVERLRESSPEGIVVRAGNRENRAAAADAIDDVMAQTPRAVDEALARARWNAVEERVRHVHQVLHDRIRIQDEIAALDDRQRKLKLASPEILLRTADEADIEPEVLLEGKLDEARNTLDAFGETIGLFRRWTKHRARLDDARATLRGLGLLIDVDDADAERCLASVADRPRRSLEPRQAFAPIERRTRELLQVLECRRKRRKAEERLGDLLPKHALEDRLAALSAERTVAGKALLDARWAAIRSDAAARTAVSQAVTAIRNGRQVDPAALRALPVWALTNLSARTNLPLHPGLFDLVVIDEASQCDAPSALPLLLRAKRAMIIGDPKQLTHVTTLSEERETLIASRWGLTDGQAAVFSYRTGSCYARVAGAKEASPIFLDLHFRSHPAIIGFANRIFYGGKLELCNDRRSPDGMRAVEWEQTQGASRPGPRGRSRINAPEAQAVVDRIARDFDAVRAQRLSIGIVTPYKAQAERIRELLGRRFGNEQSAEMTTATAHQFQGDECDVLYFSPVVDRSMGRGQVSFAADRNLINVALTRARRRLVIVGDRDACSRHDTVLRNLCAYVATLEASGFAGPVEMELAKALAQRGVRARSGITAAGHPLALAVEDGTVRLDIECDGPVFPGQSAADTARDAAVQDAGWTVMRLNVREVSRDPDGSADRVQQAVM